MVQCNKQHLAALPPYVSRYIPMSVFRSLVSAIVLSWLDYCNSLLIDLPLTHILHLQSVQNATARLLST